MFKLKIDRKNDVDGAVLLDLGWTGWWIWLSACWGSLRA